MDGVTAIQTLNDLSLELRKETSNLAKAGIEQANKERTYKIKLREEALKLRAEDMAVTLIDKVVLGIPEVADARLERDIAESNYTVIQEKINGIKLEMRILDNQISREWGIS